MKKRFTIYLAAILSAFAAFCSPVRSGLSGAGNVYTIDEEPFDNPYVTDGLVAMWDAIWNVGFGKHDDNASLWRDLINKIDAVPNNFKNVPEFQFGWGEDYCSIRHCNLDVASRLLTDTINLEDCTYEVALTRRDSSSLRLYFLDGNGGRGTWQNQNFGIYVCKGANDVRTTFGSPYGFLLDTPRTLTVVFTKDKRAIYWDGVKVGDYSVSEVASYDITTLFGSKYLYGDLTASADIFFVRIYDRTLSPAEVYHNYQIDKERFGL